MPSKIGGSSAHIERKIAVRPTNDGARMDVKKPIIKNPGIAAIATATDSIKISPAYSDQREKGHSSTLRARFAAIGMMANEVIPMSVRIGRPRTMSKSN